MTQTQAKLDFAKLLIRHKEAAFAMSNAPSMDLNANLWIERNRALRKAEQDLKNFVHPLIEEMKK